MALGLWLLCLQPTSVILREYGSVRSGNVLFFCLITSLHGTCIAASYCRIINLRRSGIRLENNKKKFLVGNYDVH